jgi:hypothetical protein
MFDIQTNQRLFSEPTKNESKAFTDRELKNLNLTIQRKNDTVI